LRFCWLGFGVRSADVCYGFCRHLQDRCRNRDDGAIGRDELHQELGLATRGITGQNEMQIADLVGFQVPLGLVIGASRRQLAALRQSPYGDDATGRHSISTVERNGQGDIPAPGRFERWRR
jgi:hypothetical protein